MLRLSQCLFFFFIGLSHVYPSCSQHDTEFPNNFNLPKSLTRISSIISTSQDLKNIKYNQDEFSILDQYRNPISDESIYQLLKDLWTNSDDKDRCFQDIKYAFKNPLANDKLGLKMLDAFGKPGSGFLEGNVRWVGNYHECTNIQAPPNENSTAGDFHGQYCMLDMSVEVFNRSLPLSLGVCLPDSCGPVPVDTFNALQMGFNITKKTCQPTSKKVTSAAIAVICVLSFFVLLALVGSFITVYEYIVKISSQDILVQYHEQINEGDMEKQIQDSSTSAAPTPNQSGWYGTTREFFNCFCVFTNGEKLLNTNGTEGELLCLHGIRFLSMSWVIVCHTYLAILTPLGNFLETATTIDTWTFQIILNGFFSVDSFFLLSGFLLAHLYFRESVKTKGKVPWLYFYIHRFVRLTPVYMMVLGFTTALQYYMGSGPFWQTSEIEPICQEKWWYNILYINNFIPSAQQCMGWTWYLANDMQFFVVSPLILITLWRWPAIGYSVLGLFMSATVAANFGITYHYELHSGYGTADGVNSLMNLDVEALAKESSLFFDNIYVKPYTRMSPYLVGIALAYYLFKRKHNNAGKLHWITLICGWIVAAAISLSCLFCLYHRKLSLIESAFYNALSHASFTAGLSWVIFTCLNKQAGPVDSILSFKLFIPLSRLTYCAYLIHPLVLSTYFGGLKASLQFSHMTIVTVFLGLLVITYAFSFVVSVLFESPIIRLDKLVSTKLMS